jgi:predicted small lipoprotein YifL
MWICLALSATSCGQKGPLMLPDEATRAHAPVDATSSPLAPSAAVSAPASAAASH